MSFAAATWSAGIDAVSSNYSSSRGDGFSDRSFSLGGMISYSVAASLDLTQYVRRQFDREDLRLTIDYRRRIESSDTVETLDYYTIDRWSEDERREGLLISFGMKL